MGVTLNSKEIKGKVNTTGLIATIGLIGPRGVKGDQGEQGNDGFSPIITTSKTGKVTTLTITDASGTKTATINDGADGSGSGDMLKATYDTNENGIVDNAEKVNNHTVESDVPSNAVFTDTTYTAGTGIDITNNVISNTQTSAEWGNISGTLNSQTDLKNALDAKQDVIDSSNKLPYSYVSGTPTIPTKISDLTNDNDTVTDSNYVHTDSNYTSAEKIKLAGIESGAQVNVDEIVFDESEATEDTKLIIEESDFDFQGLEIANAYNTAKNMAYSCDYVNKAFGGTILWTNLNPTDDFSNQTITLNSSDYDAYELIYARSKSQNIRYSTGRIPKGSSFNIFVFVGEESGGYLSYRYRNLNYVSDTSLSVSNCIQKIVNETTTGTANATCIPLYIIGYKTGLFN